MFNVGDKVVKKDGTEWNEPYKVVRIADEYGFIMLEGLNVIYCEEELKLYQEGNNVEKTFREVIVDIKEGEVWESTIDFYDIKSVELSEGYIRIEKGNKGQSLTISDDIKFKLQRKEYSFEEAFKAYEEGKEIESVVSGCEYKDEYDFDEPTNTVFTTGEIRGRWYIND